MIEKIVNRTIAKSDNCKVQYGDSSKFDILVVNITFNGNTTTYKIESKYLSTDTESIHFRPKVSTDGNLRIEWTKAVAPFIKRV